MGQPIVIENTEAVNDSFIVTMNRSLTSQVGEGYDSSPEASIGESFGALLARKLFEANDSIDRVYVASNTVVLKVSGDTDDEAASTLSTVIEDLLLFYQPI